MSQLVEISIVNRVLRIALNRPEKKNALTLEMYAAMTDALKGAATNSEVRVAILYGEGGNFTSGNDLFDFLNDPPKDQNSAVFQFLRAASTFPKPLIAAVDGHAVGIGTTILFHCDLAYAASSAKFQLPFVNLGLVPEAASSLLLPKTVGTKRAAELLLFGERFSGDEALANGLVNEVVPAENLVERAIERAETLAKMPPASLRLSKHLLRAPDADEIQSTIAKEGEHFVQALTGAEAQEALSAFIEKRPPDFSKFD